MPGSQGPARSTTASPGAPSPRYGIRLRHRENEQNRDCSRGSFTPGLGSLSASEAHGACFGSGSVVPVERRLHSICLDRTVQPDRVLTRPLGLTDVHRVALCTSLGMLLAVVPVYADDELGVGSFGVALAVSAVSPMLIPSQPIAGRIGDRRGRRVLVVAGGLIAAVSVASYTIAHSLELLDRTATVHGHRRRAGTSRSCHDRRRSRPRDPPGEALSLYSLGLWEVSPSGRCWASLPWMTIVSMRSGCSQPAVA